MKTLNDGPATFLELVPLIGVGRPSCRSDEPLEKIGADFGLSKQRMHQRHGRAIMKLRAGRVSEE
jgi:DNA-directed RNA polymerase sigma subunit (sigma70/sigma32)